MSSSVDEFFKELDRLEAENPPVKTQGTKPAAIPDFHLMQIGESAEFEVYNLADPEEAKKAPFVLPPVYDVQKELEKRHLDLFAENDKILPKDLRLLDIKTDMSTMFDVELSRPTKTYDVTFDYSTGAVNGYLEVDMDGGSTSSSSMSMTREPDAAEDFVRGSATAAPFKPGGHTSSRSRKATARADLDLASLIASDSGDRLEFSTLKEDSVLPGLGFGITFDKDNKPCKVLSDEELNKLATGAHGSEEVNLDTYSELKEDEYYDRVYRDREDDVEKRRKRNENLTRIVVEQQDVITQATSPATSTTEDSVSIALNESLTQQDPLLRQVLGRPDNSSAVEWVQQARKSVKDLPKSEWAVLDRMENISIDFHDLVPDMALEYPFELDDFQKEAVYHLEESESVFIAAHTSAGKTVVAEYAIALCMKHMTRAVYTSPIKALSNQKYRDFKDVFEDVGLITGDVSVKPDATCLIMTTEILRSMLYKGADLIRDVEWVIFDEVHYINDMERGVVWEEVIIMLPDHVNMIFLSATVPNVYEFADWVGRVKKKKIFVISTDKRPTPLEHYIYANKELFKIVDSKKQFLTNGYRAAGQSFKDKAAKQKEKAKKSGSTAPTPTVRRQPGPGKAKGEWMKIIQILKQKNLLPAVAFAFSKNKCMELATGLASSDLTSAAEKSEIYLFIEVSIKKLKGTDKTLPQVIHMRELLKRGIGVHHGGLLPLMKEIVEILFSRGLVKILFATETFAMGVNMPTRTVLFHATRKHDGVNWRDLLPGEYTQMSGRAGRRGIDAHGTVIIIAWDEVPESTGLTKMILGKSTKLESQFRLTYNMILNLFKMGGEFKVEDMIKRSFFEANNQKLLSKHKERLRQGEVKLIDLEEIVCSVHSDQKPAPVWDYLHNKLEEQRLSVAIQKYLMNSPQGRQFLEAGRVVVVNGGEGFQNAVAVILRLGVDGITNTAKVLVLTGKPSRILSDQYKVLTVDVMNINILSKNKIKADPFSVLDRPDNDHIKKIIEQLENVRMEHMPYLPPALDPVKDMKMKDLDFMELYIKKKSILEAIEQFPCKNCPDFDTQFAEAQRQQKLKEQVEALRFMLSDDSLLLMPEVEMRINVLQRLNYIDRDRIVQLKGRVAREVTTCEELIATELIFENILTPLSPEEVAALLSCLVFQDKTENEIEVPERLQTGYKSLQTLGISLANLQIEYGLKMSPLEYVKEHIQPGLMEVVYEWARNMPFSEITKLTDVQEGSIVRTIVRLDETLRDFKNAARIVGDTDLAKKMEEASHLIKRDIVFASSLYITGK